MIDKNNSTWASEQNVMWGVAMGTMQINDTFGIIFILSFLMMLTDYPIRKRFK